MLNSILTGYICTYMYMYIYMYVYIYIHIYVYVYIYVWIYMDFFINKIDWQHIDMVQSGFCLGPMVQGHPVWNRTCTTARKACAFSFSIWGGSETWKNGGSKHPKNGGKMVEKWKNGDFDDADDVSWWLTMINDDWWKQPNGNSSLDEWWLTTGLKWIINGSIHWIY